VSLECIVPEGLDEGDKDWDTDTLSQAFYDRLSVVLGERISQCGSKVPVITGAPGCIHARHTYT
jgi:aspartate kinase